MGVSQVSGPKNLAPASLVRWGHIWVLSEVPLGERLQDGCTDRQMDKQRYEGRKGTEALNQCARGKAPPEEERGQKAEEGFLPTYLLCLLDKTLLKVTLPLPTGQSVEKTNVGQREEGAEC